MVEGFELGWQGWLLKEKRDPTGNFGEMIPLTATLKWTCPMCNGDYRPELRGEDSDVNREVVRTA